MDVCIDSIGSALQAFVTVEGLWNNFSGETSVFVPVVTVTAFV
jgi:hypothetical protein